VFSEFVIDQLRPALVRISRQTTLGAISGLAKADAPSPLADRRWRLCKLPDTIRELIPATVTTCQLVALDQGNQTVSMTRDRLNVSPPPFDIAPIRESGKHQAIRSANNYPLLNATTFGRQWQSLSDIEELMEPSPRRRRCFSNLHVAKLAPLASHEPGQLFYRHFPYTSHTSTLEHCQTCPNPPDRSVVYSPLGAVDPRSFDLGVAAGTCSTGAIR